MATATKPGELGDGGFHDPTAERERLRVAAEIGTLGVWDWDLRRDRLYWSSTLMEIVGLAPERFTGTPADFFDRLHPDDVDGVQAMLQAHFERGVPYDAVMRVRHEDGSYLNLGVRGRAYRDDEGQPYRMIGVIIDVTPVVATQEALAASERRFRDMAANVPGAIFRYVLHPDGSDEIAYMSEGCVSLWEVTADDIQGDPTLLWGMVLREDFPLMQASVMRSAETLESWAHRYRIRTPSGTLKWLQARGVPTKRADGAIVWNTLLIDVSDQVRTEEELRESREMLFHAQKMDALGQLTGGLAHDFNNLLSVIISGIESVEHHAGGLARTDREALEDALAAAQRGAVLTRSLLGFARRAELDPEVLALSTVVGSMRSLVRRTLPDNVELVVTPIDDDVAIHVDRSSLENALLNLVLNARDALPKGGRVTVRAGHEHRPAPSGLESADYVFLRVEDDGTGMSEETLSRVFEPFFTTKGHRGNGMGLAMIHGFVQQSGGSAEVESELGRGTRVTLFFPRAPEGSAAIPLVVPASRAPRLEDVRVLFVEDEDAVRRSVARLLRSSGLDVTVAADGVEALRLLRAASAAFDVVLSDLRMPGAVQGEDLAREVGHAVPVLLLTGNPPETRVAGAMATLTKPIGHAELVRAIVGAVAAGAARAG